MFTIRRLIAIRRERDVNNKAGCYVKVETDMGLMIEFWASERIWPELWQMAEVKQ